MTLTLLYKRCLLARRHVYQNLTQCYDLPIKFRSCSDGVVIFDFIFFILLQVKQNIYQICNALLIVDRTRFVQKTLLWIHWNRVRLNTNLERILIYRDTFPVIYFLSSIIGKTFTGLDNIAIAILFLFFLSEEGTDYSLESIWVHVLYLVRFVLLIISKIACSSGIFHFWLSFRFFLTWSY
jgi:hypothetical protein